MVSLSRTVALKALHFATQCSYASDIILTINSIYFLNPLTPELIPPHNAACRDFLLGILIFKGLTAGRLYKLFCIRG
jgi:hypothetical protein